MNVLTAFEGMIGSVPQAAKRVLQLAVVALVIAPATASAVTYELTNSGSVNLASSFTFDEFGASDGITLTTDAARLVRTPLDVLANQPATLQDAGSLNVNSRGLGVRSGGNTGSRILAFGDPIASPGSFDTDALILSFNRKVRIDRIEATTFNELGIVENVVLQLRDPDTAIIASAALPVAPTPAPVHGTPLRSEVDLGIAAIEGTGFLITNGGAPNTASGFRIALIEVTAVPLPASLAMLLAGVAGLGIAGRRRARVA